MPRPLVAVIGRRAESVPILRFSATLAAEAMCEAVYAGGAEPVVFHALGAGPGPELAARLARYDGILMPGGADLGPERYGQVAGPTVLAVVPWQDVLDIAVTTAVIESGQPMLTICRGMQILNVVCGGTLVQDLVETTVPHRSSPHDVATVEGSRLRKVTGADTLTVSSYHHQCVDRLGDGLTVTGTAADGVVEAVEHDTADILAVQWHPEDLFATSATDLALFEDLAERAARAAS
jgi:putative glutamine amidotransferase